MRMLTDQTALDALLAAGGPAWLLKHSATCPISAAAHDEVRAYAAAHPDEPVGVIVVQSHRPLSNAVAARLGFAHQSPQLFLLRDGAVRWQASHWSITRAAMEAAKAK